MGPPQVVSSQRFLCIEGSIEICTRKALHSFVSIFQLHIQENGYRKRVTTSLSCFGHNLKNGTSFKKKAIKKL